MMSNNRQTLISLIIHHKAFILSYRTLICNYKTLICKNKTLICYLKGTAGARLNHFHVSSKNFMEHSHNTTIDFGYDMVPVSVTYYKVYVT